MLAGPDRAYPLGGQAAVGMQEGHAALVSLELARFDESGQTSLDQPVETLGGS